MTQPHDDSTPPRNAGSQPPTVPEVRPHAPSPTPDAGGAAPPAPAGGRLPFVPGYEVLEELGRGGMGVVYKARQAALKRVVALKMVLSGEHAGPRELERFRAEAETVARLQHPNIVQVYEVGESGGHPYFALEFVDGGSLSQLLKARRLPPAEAAGLVEALARAMHLAHSRNVVHRDLKPANVLLTKDGTPKVSDFGLARQLDADSGRTHTGTVMGTPSYMAPEQAAGHAHAAGPAADVYALGAILYECLSGRPPFQGGSREETLERVRTRAPDAPSRLRPGVPRDLETVCLKCLRKEPERRYASALALADDLGRWRRGEPILARPVGLAERAAKWVRRRPGAALLAAVTALAAAALVGLLVARGVNDRLEGLNADLRRAADEAERERRRAVEQEGRARRFQYAADMRLAGPALLGAARHTGDVERALELLERQRPGPGQPDLRGPEWHLLWRLCHRERATLLGEPAAEKGGAFWMESFLRVAFCADGRGVLVGSTSGGVQLWGPDGGRARALAPAKPLFAIDHIEFRGWLTPLPDGRSVLIASDGDTAVRVIDLADGSVRRAVWHDQARPARQIAVSPDGVRVALACADKVVRLRDLATGAALADVATPKGFQPMDAAFSPADPTLLAVGGFGKTVHLWDAGAGAPVAALTAPGPTGTVLAFSPDGKTLATVTAGEREAYLWDVAAARGAVAAPKATLRLPAPFNGRLRFAPAGDCLAAGLAGDDVEGPAECLLWDVKASKERARLAGHQGWVMALAFTPDGATLATAGVRDGVIRVWDVATGRPRTTLIGHTAPVFDLAFRGDGRALASAGGTIGLRDNVFARAEAKLWDAAAWEAPAAVAGGAPWALAPDGRTLAVSDGYFDGKKQLPPRAVELYDLATGRRRARLEGQYHAGYSADGRTLVTAPRTGLAVSLWDADTGAARATRDVPTGPRPAVIGAPRQLLPTPDGRALVVCQSTKDVMGVPATPRDPAVVLVDAGGLAEKARWPGASGPVQLGAAGATMAAYGEGPSLKILDLTTGGVRRTFPLEAAKPAPPAPFALSPDGGCLALAGGQPAPFVNQPVTLFDADTGAERAALRGEVRRLRCLAFSPDGRTLATGHGDPWVAVGWVKLWDAATGAELATLWGHRSAVNDLLFTPDGDRLISASTSGVTFWDPHIGQAVLALPGGSGLQLSRDGRTLAVGPSGEDGSEVRLWRAPAEEGEQPAAPK